jgi:hypothetical protein
MVGGSNDETDPVHGACRSISPLKSTCLGLPLEVQPANIPRMLNSLVMKLSKEEAVSFMN